MTNVNPNPNQYIHAIVYNLGYNIASGKLGTSRGIVGTAGDVVNVGMAAAGFGNYKNPATGNSIQTAGGSAGGVQPVTDAYANQGEGFQSKAVITPVLRRMVGMYDDQDDDEDAFYEDHSLQDDDDEYDFY